MTNAPGRVCRKWKRTARAVCALFGWVLLIGNVPQLEPITLTDRAPAVNLRFASHHGAPIDAPAAGANNPPSVTAVRSLPEEFPMSLTTPAARRDLSFHLHPATNLRPVQTEGPLVITRGEGVYVFDDEGRRYLEGMAGLWCASLGFSERRLADAAYRQMCELPFYHSFAGKVPAICTELAERLIRMAPAGMGRRCSPTPAPRRTTPRSSSPGTSTTRSGRPEKKKIISRQRAYHGVTVATASLTGLAFAHTDFDLPIARILHTDCPHYYRGAQPGESEEAFADAPRRQARAADPARRSRHGRRLLRRAGDGRGRRDHAAGDLFRPDPADAAEVRHPVRRRRGDLRLRPHRQHVRLADVSTCSRTS